MLTVSGYMKSDMYAIMKREMLIGKYDVVCCIAAEILCCGSNEIAHMIGFLIDIIALHATKFNPSLMLNFVSSVKHITSIPKRTLLIDKEFYFHLCKILAYVMAITGPNEVSKLGKVNQKAAVDISNTLETLTYDDDVVMKCMSQVKRFKKQLDYQSMRYVCVFSWAIRKKNRDLAMFILRKLYYAKELSCLELPVNIALNERVSNDLAKQDIVWILWHVLLKDQEDGSLISCLANLFVQNYTRGRRTKRANFIYYATRSAINKRDSQDVVHVNESMIHEASDKIGGLFKEFLETKRMQMVKEDDENENENGECEKTRESNVSFAMPKRRKKKKKTIRKDIAEKSEEMPMYLRVLPRRKCQV
jgi:hypothetical protein